MAGWYTVYGKTNGFFDNKDSKGYVKANSYKEAESKYTAATGRSAGAASTSYGGSPSSWDYKSRETKVIK